MGGPPPKRRKRMKLEDMRVGVLVKCTKPEWDCYGDIFEITKKLSDDEWEIIRRPYVQMRQSGKTIKALNPVSIVSQQTLQNNFKLKKYHTVRREIKIVCFADNKTFISDGTANKSVGLYHEDKYDEFVGAVEALAKLYGRKSPFDEIEELKEAARAAEDTVEATEVSDEWSTVEKEYSYGDTVKLEEKENTAIKTESFEVDAKELYAKPHSPVDDMDLTPPLEAGCLIKLKNPYTDKLKGKWFKVACIGTCLGHDTAVIPVFLKPNKITLKAFQEKDLEVVCERYRNIWDSELKLKYQFGDRVVLTQTGFNVKRKSYGTVIDWRQYSNENYYIVHWDDEDARFIEGKEELIPEYCLLPVRYE